MPLNQATLTEFGHMMKALYPLGWSQVRILDGEFKLGNRLTGGCLTIAVVVNLPFYRRMLTSVVMDMICRVLMRTISHSRLIRFGTLSSAQE